jgi:adenosylcobinamide-phosphate synthase
VRMSFAGALHFAVMPLDPFVVVAVLVLEACVGYPKWLQRGLPHPVVALGRLIDALERRWNRPHWSDRRRCVLGILTVFITAGFAATVGLGIQSACLAALSADALIAAQPIATMQPESGYVMSIGAWVVLVLCATPGLAQRSLYEHVVAVARPLASGDLQGARGAVAMIVGRDTQSLEESGVAAAAIESLAESFNDGIVAPAFWLCFGGLPGLFAYKAVNTADSLIGHLEPRWRHFGWAAARTDDLMNWIPARIAGLLIAMAAGQGLRTMMRDAHKHASPNAGWPEAAMAGALALRLGGPAIYDGQKHDRPWFGSGPPPSPGDLKRALKLYVRACLLLWLMVAAVGISLAGVAR